MSQFEKDIEKECSNIVKTEPEYWESRNKSVLKLTSIITALDDDSQISHNIYRILKDPIKSMIGDLRSQQVRDTCTFLTKMSEVTKDNMKYLLREIFPFLIDGVKVPNKVMSGYVDECILDIIKNTAYKQCMSLLIAEIKENKAKFVREKCFEYINEVLLICDITEKDADTLLDTIKNGMEDASVRAREIARLAYLNIFQIYPKKAEKIKASVSAALKSRLQKAEQEQLKNHIALAAIRSATASYSAVDVTAASTTAITSDICATSNENSTTDDKTTAASLALNYTDSESFCNVTPIKTVPLRARRLSCQEDAVTSIQAIIRGKLQRKQSLCGGTASLMSPGSYDEITTIITTTTTTTSTIEPDPDSKATTLSVPSIPSEGNDQQFDMPEQQQQCHNDNTKVTSNTITATTSISTTTSSFATDLNLKPSSLPPVPPTAAAEFDVYPNNFALGMTVLLHGKSESLGIIRFIGMTAFADGYWIGLELNECTGKNNGSVKGDRYFTCADNKGLFVRPTQIHPYNTNSNSTHTNNSTISSNDRNQPVGGLLKLKIFNMMKLLNQQLEVIETIDKKSKLSHNKQIVSNSTSCSSIDKKIIELLESVCDQEIEIINQFKHKMKLL